MFVPENAALFFFCFPGAGHSGHASPLLRSTRCSAMARAAGVVEHQRRWQRADALELPRELVAEGPPAERESRPVGNGKAPRMGPQFVG